MPDYVVRRSVITLGRWSRLEESTGWKTDGASVWPVNFGGRMMWLGWIDGPDMQPEFRASEAEAKAYAESVLPFAQVLALK